MFCVFSKKKEEEEENRNNWLGYVYDDGIVYFYSMVWMIIISTDEFKLKLVLFLGIIKKI